MKSELEYQAHVGPGEMEEKGVPPLKDKKRSLPVLVRAQHGVLRSTARPKLGRTLFSVDASCSRLDEELHLMLDGFVEADFAFPKAYWQIGVQCEEPETYHIDLVDARSPRNHLRIYLDREDLRALADLCLEVLGATANADLTSIKTYDDWGIKTS